MLEYGKLATTKLGSHYYVKSLLLVSAMPGQQSTENECRIFFSVYQCFWLSGRANLLTAPTRVGTVPVQHFQSSVTNKPGDFASSYRLKETPLLLSVYGASS